LRHGEAGWAAITAKRWAAVVAEAAAVDFSEARLGGDVSFHDEKEWGDVAVGHGGVVCREW
jgi:hypothetical protein